MRMVVCAAVRNLSGLVVCSPRHFDKTMCQIVSPMARQEWNQGFVDQYGVFLTREEAFTVAFDAGQILRRVGGDEGKLFSENLY